MTLGEMFQTLRAMSAENLAEQVAKEAAPRLQAAVEQTASRGTSPDGKPWAPRKAGGRAYKAAAAKIETKAYGNLVRMTLSGPEVFGHFGFKGAEPRPMIPEAGAGNPPVVNDALNDAATAVFERATKGAR